MIYIFLESNIRFSVFNHHHIRISRPALSPHAHEPRASPPPRPPNHPPSLSTLHIPLISPACPLVPAAHPSPTLHAIRLPPVPLSRVLPYSTHAPSFLPPLMPCTFELSLPAGARTTPPRLPRSRTGPHPRSAPARPHARTARGGTLRVRMVLPPCLRVPGRECVHTRSARAPSSRSLCPPPLLHYVCLRALIPSSSTEAARTACACVPSVVSGPHDAAYTPPHAHVHHRRARPVEAPPSCGAGTVKVRPTLHAAQT